MPFAPLDKNSYKESKRRRRQALDEERTGRIYPLSNPKKRLTAVLCCAGVLLAVCAAALTVFFCSVNKSAATPDTAVSSDSGLLLTVVNASEPLEKDFVPELKTVSGFEINADAAKPLEEFIEASRLQNAELKIKSAYISFDEQKSLYEEKLENLLATGKYTSVRAEAAAARTVPPAGCSEAQTGLLVAFELENSAQKAFLERECVNFGFVLRYPDDKTSLTKMDYSDCVYRYVGKENAVKMRSFGMCLEEYVSYLEQQNR